MGEVNAQLLTQEISTLNSKQLEEVMHFVGYLKSLPAVTSAANEPEHKRQAEIKGALEKLSAANTFGDIVDPVEWQRETRIDRQLSGRTN